MSAEPTFRDKGDAWTASDATLLGVILGLGPSSAAIPHLVGSSGTLKRSF